MPLNSYREWLKQDLSGLIETLSLSDLQKHFMRSRWLDQVLWMEGMTDQARDRYYALRLITIVGGLIVPAYMHPLAIHTHFYLGREKRLEGTFK